MGWSGSSGMFALFLEMMKYIIMARILDPGVFGLLAMAMVFISIGRIFSDGGTSNAVIHFENHTKGQLSTLFWVNIMAGSLLFAVIFSLSNAAATFYGEAEVGRILRLSAFILPAYAAGALHEVLLRKQLLFKRIAFAETVSAAAGFVTAVLLAVTGHGVYALVWSYLVVSLTQTMICVIAGRHLFLPRLYFRFGEVRNYLKFGLYQMGERALNVYSTRIDQLIIGRFFGPEILGAYFLAFQLLLFPLLRLSPLLNRVAFPVFSTRQHDNAILRNGYLTLLQGVLAVSIPLFMITALSAPWLIPLVFGQGWEISIRLVPFMVVIGLLRMAGNPSGNIALSKGRASLLFYWNLMAAAVNTGIFLLGAQYSIYALAALYLLVNIIYFIAGQTILVNRLIGLDWGRLLRAVRPVLLATLIAVALTAVFSYLAGGAREYITASGDLKSIQDVMGMLVLLWKDSVIWSQASHVGRTGMVFAIAGLFLILYLPVVWRYHSGIARDFMGALFTHRFQKKEHRQ